MDRNIEIRQALEMKEGVGADVKRIMPIQGFMNFDPFLLWDHFDVKPGTGFPDHPHRGFEGLTYIFEGSMNHTDNLGNSTTVTPGGAQRFTAGRGLVHSEMPSPEGNTRGIQLWINLPKRLKKIKPAYQQVNAVDIPEKMIDKGKVRTIVGDNSPLKLHTDVSYKDVHLEEGGSFEENLVDGHRGFIYIVDGKVTVNDNSIGSGEALFFDSADTLNVSTDESCRFMVCVGTPWNEPVVQHGPFVD